MQVMLECDHSQTTMHCSHAGVDHVEDVNEYMTNCVHKDDLSGDEPEVFVLQAY
jgi:hypothetical protein